MDFAGVASRSDVASATEDDIDDTNSASNANDGIEDDGERIFNGASVAGVSAVDKVNDKVGNDEGKGNDSEAEDGIENGVFGFLKLGCITRRSHVADAADDQEDGGNDAGGADEPVDHIMYNIFGRDGGIWTAVESASTAKKGNMDRV